VIQQAHENSIGYETRCRQMLEVVRAHKAKLKGNASAESGMESMG